MSISAILVGLSIIAILFFGFKSGIDFKGGTLWQVRLAAGDQQQTADKLKEFFEKDIGMKNVVIFPAADQNYLIRIESISEENHQQYLNSLKSKFGNINPVRDRPAEGTATTASGRSVSNGVEELRFESIGPTIGKELENKALWAIALVILGISIYVAYAFRKVSYPVKSWKYGLITLITLFHDVAIPSGLFAVLGWKLGIEIDTNFIVALLVIMGFSVHDTIVVFDRIRENLIISRINAKFSEIVNNSVNQTLVRSINTSLTVLLVLLALFLFGPVSLKYFILTILVGIIGGTYSSIFVASPALVIVNRMGESSK